MLVLLAAGLSLANLDSVLHPLPSKRFVALMAWPAAPNSSTLPLLKGALDAIESHLARAEASSKDLMIISTADVAGQAALGAPTDAGRVLGANLVLTASLQPEHDGVVLKLAVLDAASANVLRKDETHIANSNLNQIPDRAAASAANLLNVRLAAGPWKDHDELASVPLEAYQAFSAAEDFMAQPNDSGLDQAIEKYQKALDAAPRFALAYAKLSMAYTRKFQKLQDPAALSLAGRNADLALRYNKDSAMAALSRALVDLSSGNTSQALDGLQRAAQLDPGDPQIPLIKAHAFRNLDRRTEEEAVYREIIASRPNFWPAYNELGLNLYRQGNYQKAADVFAEGSAVAPRVARLVTNIGSMQQLLKHNELAAEAFRRSILLAPTEFSYSNLGTLAYGDQDYPKALSYYEKARDLNPKSDLVWRNIGDCYAQLGQEAQVNESYTKAAEVTSNLLKTNPKVGSVWMNFAFYKAKLGHRAEAESAMLKAQELGSTDLHSQLIKAQALALVGKKGEALDLVLDCLKKGLSQTQVELALDLKEVRTDPRYLRAVAAGNRKAKDGTN
jgi:tetratricopeptide (TPR) repeat protein